MPSCAHSGAPPSSTVQRVLLVGWEGADWRLIEPLVERGGMPHLAGMMESGVMGALRLVVPPVCPVLWTSIATGVRGDRHGILTLVEPDGRGDVRPVQSSSRQRKAIWNILSQNGLQSVVLGWPASHPAEHIRGIVASDRFPLTGGPASKLWPADEWSIHPAELSGPLMRLRVRPEDVTDSQLRSFVPAIDETSGLPHVEILRRLVAAVATVQAAATWATQKVAWNLLAIQYGLAGQLCQELLGNGAAPDWARHVVETGFRLLDLMLGRLRGLVGPETLVLVVSDHGFRPPPKVPPPALPEVRQRSPPSRAIAETFGRHYANGILCAAGPGIRTDELVFGASPLDVTPTILAALGQPVADDMEGKVLTRLFERPPSARSIESYEATAPDDGMPPVDLREDPWALEELRETLAVLGDDCTSFEAAAALEECVRQRQRCLVEIHASRRQFDDAVASCRELLAHEDSIEVRIRHAECLIRSGRLDEAAQAIEVLGPPWSDSPHVEALRAWIHADRGSLRSARDSLDRAEGSGVSEPHILVRLGGLALRLRRPGQARRFFERALDRDVQFPQAHEGLGIALLRVGDVQGSVVHLAESIRLLYDRSPAHARYGEALVAAGEWSLAIRAFENALNLDPENRSARKWLQRLKGATG